MLLSFYFHRSFKTDDDHKVGLYLSETSHLTLAWSASGTRWHWMNLKLPFNCYSQLVLTECRVTLCLNLSDWPESYVPLSVGAPVRTLAKCQRVAKWAVGLLWMLFLDFFFFFEALHNPREQKNMPNPLKCTWPIVYSMNSWIVSCRQAVFILLFFFKAAAAVM